MAPVFTGGGVIRKLEQPRVCLAGKYYVRRLHDSTWFERVRINPPSARLYNVSTTFLGVLWKQSQSILRKVVDVDDFSLRKTNHFRLGMLVLERKLSSWGIGIGNNSIDSRKYRYIGIWYWEG